MGADGGYLYVSREKLRKYLSEEEISLWLRFTRHDPNREVWREDLCDVDEEETRLFKNLGEFYRFIYGTDVHEEVRFFYDFSNPPEEVWYWKTWMEEAGYLSEDRWVGGWGYHWLNSPNSWYEAEIGPDNSYRVRLPTPDELETLLSINERIENHVPFHDLETWT